MKATNWEFTNRALVFGLIFGATFPLYLVDHEMSTVAVAGWLGARLGVNGDFLARAILGGAAVVLVVAALIRTWASAYLHAGVVYASDVKTDLLVADGPYRRARNPLYFANVLMAVGMGALMSRSGLLVAVVAMVVFCYRLILREEAELRASQGEAYKRYLRAVPRLWPSPRARIAAAGRPARWGDAFKAESWYWGFAAAVTAFAITLNVKLFFGILAASLVLFWLMSMAVGNKADSASSSAPK
jgi:protein-S-isoprenylcysteine O-methyltransferase Ste14